MNFVKFGFLFNAILLIELSIANGPALAVDSVCPTDKELDPKCKCFESMKYMTCDAPMTAFKLLKPYALDTLIVRSGNASPLISERIDTAHKLTAANLLINAEALPTTATAESLQDLFSIATESVKIVAKKDAPISIAVSHFPITLKSIILSNVKILGNFNLEKFTILQNLELENVDLGDFTRSPFFVPTLTRIVITGSTNLNGMFSFKPKDCKDGQKIYIDLSNNQQLIGLDFGKLFDFDDVKVAEKCKYHIELSGSKGIVADLLKTYTDYLVKAKDNPKVFKPTVGQIYLVMHDLEIECDCNVYTWWKLHAGYIHSAKCKFVAPAPVGTKYFEEINDKDIAGCKDVPKAAVTI